VQCPDGVVRACVCCWRDSSSWLCCLAAVITIARSVVGRCHDMISSEFRIASQLQGATVYPASSVLSGERSYGYRNSFRSDFNKKCY